MSETIPVWMDVDTGTDDAVALLSLHALKGTEIIGLSTVCGNSGPENSYRNTRCINTICKSSYPVYRGADKPLLREPFHAAEVHGKNGLGDVKVELPEEETVYTLPAWDALNEAAEKYSGKLRLIATAPLSNLAIAFSKYPSLAKHLHSILIMGGATREGNVTPCAEFNIYADPEGADIVFRAGVPIYLFPLDVTERVCLTREDLKELAAKGNRAGKFVHDILQVPMSFHSALHHPGVQMHDCCPVLFLDSPELFDMEEAGVAVETKGKITCGKTVTDLYSDKQFEFKNAMVAVDVDEKAFIEKLKGLIESIG
ncbi:MAG: nucleoside hydrolase [Lachnospiraceae bacterium]|nr:nucleoside hydrolase [Lachnospiraceae bacterium]